MLLEEINFSYSKDYIHMERFVNKGSPSGKTDKFNTEYALRKSL